MIFSSGVHSLSGRLGFLAKTKPVVLIWSLSPNSSRSKLAQTKASRFPSKDMFKITMPFHSTFCSNSWIGNSKGSESQSRIKMLYTYTECEVSPLNLGSLVKTQAHPKGNFTAQGCSGLAEETTLTPCISAWLSVPIKISILPVSGSWTNGTSRRCSNFLFCLDQSTTPDLFARSLTV